MPTTMSKTTLMHLLVLVLMVMLTPDHAQGHTTCTAVTTTLETSITCIFGLDMSSYSFNVQFFFPNLSADEEITLACNRLRSGGLVCDKKGDVHFDQNQEIKDRLTFTRATSRNKVGGQYLCQEVPTQGESAEPCTLIFKDSPPEQPTPQPPNDTWQTSAIITVVLLVLVIAIIVVFEVLRTRPNRITQCCTNAIIGRLCPGAIGDPPENNPQDSSATENPEGGPTCSHNKSAQQEADTPERDLEANLSESATSAQPLLHTSGAGSSATGDQGESGTTGELGADAEKKDWLWRKWFKKQEATAEETVRKKDGMERAKQDKQAEQGGSPSREHQGTDTESRKEREAGETAEKPGTKEEQKTRMKAEEERVKKEKQEAKRKAKSMIEGAERRAKQMKEEARGGTEEEKKEPEERAKQEIENAKKEAKEMNKAEEMKQEAEKRAKETKQMDTVE